MTRMLRQTWLWHFRIVYTIQSLKTSHVTTSMILTIAFRNCRDFRKWCEIRRLLANTLVFLHSIEMRYWVIFTLDIHAKVVSYNFELVASDAMTTSWFLEMRARNFVSKTLQIFLSVLEHCNNDQQILIVYLLLYCARYLLDASSETTHFFKVWEIVWSTVRSKTSISARNRQKE